MYKPKIISKMQAQAAKAVETVVMSEKGAAALAGAMRRVQDGRSKIDEQATRMIAALGVATKADVERVGDKVRKLRKQVQALLDDTRGG